MNTLRISTLRPGLLVSLKTSVKGNVSYERNDVEVEHFTEEGMKRAKWETERTVKDPAEHEEAIRVQSKASALIRAVCTKSDFGLLCPLLGTAALDRAIAEARALTSEFNSRAKLTRVRVNVISGTIAPDDKEAVLSINAEVRDLLEEMQKGISEQDVKVVRDAASRAKQLGAMLSPAAAARVQIAVDAARATAKVIVKAGEAAGLEIDQRTIQTIGEQRTAFLDFDDLEAPVQAPVVKSRALDFNPDDTTREFSDLSSDDFKTVEA